MENNLPVTLISLLTNYLSNLGFKVDVFYGAKTKDLLIIRDKIEKAARKVYYATNNGSYGIKGFVTDLLINRLTNYDVIVAIGPVLMKLSLQLAMV